MDNCPFTSDNSFTIIEAILCNMDTMNHIKAHATIYGSIFSTFMAQEIGNIYAKYFMSEPPFLDSVKSKAKQQHEFRMVFIK